ncbi:hypothetical protein [Frigoribacterium sp. CG_9.8]|uniref:hypothetical protein n=1 Tax=Frigoribacterium sp. CG_9.8 TaxID=2787733 RepID=UPI0018CBB099|nr:hypothetical protein [Frigoribacterium sp. CG_9.8]MBG6106635.1 hypothetical protein [Frigoribacterium sp. CG_9.8]
MAVNIGIQQPPLPRYAIGLPLSLNYLATPHATLQRRLWSSTSATLGAPILRTDETEQFLRFTRASAGAAVVTINDSSLAIPAGTFDVRIWIRTSAIETSCTLGLRRGQSQVTADNITGAIFSTTTAWTATLATITIDAATNWTLVLRLGNGTAGTLIDVKLGSIMPNGQMPFVGDSKVALGSTDFYYWEGATNGSRSIRTTRNLSNAPGPYYAVENLTTYTISENASPLSPADTTGGATTVQLGIREFDDSMLLGGGELTVLDSGRAIIQGGISSPTSDGNTVSITSMSVIARLNVVRRVAPFVGSLDGYIATLLASVGVTRPLNVDIGIAERPVAVPGFKDNVLTRVKEFCAAQGVELSDLGDAVYIRLPRTRSFNGSDVTQIGTSADASQLAQSVEVFNYNSRYLVNALVYPPASYDDATGTSSDAGWTMDAAILSVDSGSVTTIEVPVLGSLVSVEQPVCVKEVAPSDGAAGSVYTVMGQGSVDGGAGSIQTLDPAVWTQLGGSVTVKVGDNFDTIIITITSGTNEPTLAPFAISMGSGDSTYYSTLRVRGTGIINRKEKFTYLTGLSSTEASGEVGVTIDTAYVQTRDMADRVASETVPMFSRPVVNISGTTDNPGLMPGDIAGSRFRSGDSVYRVITAPTGESGTSFTAVADTTMDDFDAVWALRTFDDFDAVWATRTDLQFAGAPLRQT